MNNKVKLLINFLLVNGNWYLFLKLPVEWQSIAWIGLGINLILTLKWAKNQPKEAIFLLLVTLWGCCMEMIFIHTTTLIYSEPRIYPSMFMIALWINFACSIPLSLKWLAKDYRLGIIFGAIAGPLCYYSGSRISSELVAITDYIPIIILAIIWAITLVVAPLLYKQFSHEEVENYVTT